MPGAPACSKMEAAGVDAGGQVPEIVFVGGAPRSGTTLLSALLGTARGCQPFCPEYHYLNEVVQAWAFGLANFETSTGFFARSRETLTDLHFQFVERLLEEAWQATDRPRRLVIKHCNLTPLFPVLAGRLPNALFVVVRRDARDIVASLQRALRRTLDLTADRSLLEQWVGRYNDYYGAIARSRSLFGGRLLAVRYEDILARPGPLLADFIGDASLDPDQVWRRASFDLVSMARDDALRSDLWGRPVSDERHGDFRATLGADIAEFVREHTTATSIAFDRLVASEDNLAQAL